MSKVGSKVWQQGTSGSAGQVRRYIASKSSPTAVGCIGKNRGRDCRAPSSPIRPRFLIPSRVAVRSPTIWTMSIGVEKAAVDLFQGMSTILDSIGSLILNQNFRYALNKAI